MSKRSSSTSENGNYAVISQIGDPSVLTLGKALWVGVFGMKKTQLHRFYERVHKLSAPEAKREVAYNMRGIGSAVQWSLRTLEDAKRFANEEHLFFATESDRARLLRHGFTRAEG